MHPAPHPNTPLLARPSGARRPAGAAHPLPQSEYLHTMESWLAGVLVGGLAWAGLLALRPVDGPLGVVLMLGVAAAVVEWRGQDRAD